LNKTHHGSKGRCVLTSAGELKVVRVYFRSVKCQCRGFVADERLGIDGRFNIAVQRLFSLAATSWSYDISSHHLTPEIPERTQRNSQYCPSLSVFRGPPQDYASVDPGHYAGANVLNLAAQVDEIVRVHSDA
jgi:hypothetical protein